VSPLKSDNVLKWTGERLITSIADETATEHLHRYQVAMGFCQNKVIVDIASGEGYGSNFLASVATKVIGVDIDPYSVEFASNKYNKSNLSFQVGNCASIPVESNTVDVVVSFETLEHHDQHEEMMLEIKRVLKPGGLLIISSPDKTYYSDKRNFKNSFHVKELTKKQFSDLLNRHFKNSLIANQKIMYGSFIVPDEDFNTSFYLYEGDYAAMNSLTIEPLYNFALASDDELPLLSSSFFNGDQILVNRTKSILNSQSYKLGYLLLSPFRVLKRWIGKM